MVTSRPRQVLSSSHLKLQISSPAPRSIPLRFLFAIFAIMVYSDQVAWSQTFHEAVAPLLTTYCVDCHSGDDPNGNIDFSQFDSDAAAKSQFELWPKVVELLEQRRMPPSDEPQPSQREVALYRAWYQESIVNSVQAKPARFRPRRLSATEYRNTMRSLFGFDLKVNIREAEQTLAETSLILKLLPLDPPGPSRFRNDTSANPLTSHLWEQYSYLSDTALQQWFVHQEIDAKSFSLEEAQSRLVSFLPRVFRRPVAKDQLRDATSQLESSADIAGALRREMKAALMSPAFLYRGLLATGTPGEQELVDEFELAERMSYFIWADMPDTELMELAREKRLRENLTKQVERMLDDPKSHQFTDDFATQWLTLNEIEHVSNNPPYMLALRSQPIDFFRYLIAEDRPIMELIDSQVTFANPLTRKFYQADAKQLGKYRKPRGIEIEAVSNQKLGLENTVGRGGLITMPGVLAMNRGPILRGVWMLERILGEHLPDPPADVGQVEANIPGENLSFRERFAKHRDDERCAVCHDKIDPLGFALSGYDDNGAFRLGDDDQRQKKRKTPLDADLDASGTLPSGEAFADFDELKGILRIKYRQRITRNIVQQMMAYALGRKLEIYDQPSITSIVEALLRDDEQANGKRAGSWRNLIQRIVGSLPFQEAYFPGAEDDLED